MKRMVYFLVQCTLVMSVGLVAQKRYLVTPANQAIPLKVHESAAEVMKGMMTHHALKSPDTRSAMSYGYPSSDFPVTDSISTFYKDILAMWFTAPVAGKIDTIFWQAGHYINAVDSTLYLRVHRSYIGPDNGPGNGYPLPCEGWGYWYNTNDFDIIAA